MKQSLATAYATKRRARTKAARPEPELNWEDAPEDEVMEPQEAPNKPNLRNIIQNLRKQKMTQNED